MKTDLKYNILQGQVTLNIVHTTFHHQVQTPVQLTKKKNKNPK